MSRETVVPVARDAKPQKGADGRSKRDKATVAARKSPLKKLTRSGPADTSLVILDGALDLFSERNFSSVTIKDIAAKVKLNTALIYYYFGSKEELFRRCVSRAVDQAFAQFEHKRSRMTSPEDVILEWLETHIRAYVSIRKLIKLSIDYATASRKMLDIDQAIRRFYDGESALLLSCLQQGIEQGLFRPIDAPQTALFISTYLDGVIVRSIILSEFDYKAAIHEMKRFMHELLHT